MGISKITIAQIKNYIKKMVEFNFINQKALSMEQSILGSKIENISYALFMAKKEKIKTYTVFNDNDLKKFRIGEDNSKLELKVLQKFKNNSDIFHELVADTYIGRKTKNSAKTENHIFYCKIYSQYSYRYEEVFFAHINNDFFVVLDFIQTNIKDFLETFFGKIESQEQNELEQICNNKIISHDEMQILINDFCKKISKRLEDEISFQKGAITFFDFLGWKGLWLDKRELPLREVTELIDKIKMQLHKITKEVTDHPDNFEISHLISISDTIALFTPHVPMISRKEVLEIHARVGQFVLEETIKKKYAIRGAITYGEYSFKDNVMIGPGIDECASWHEQCNWIGAHFSPKAQFVLDDEGYNEEYINKGYNIPIKNGLPKPKYCVSWFVSEAEMNLLLDSVKSVLPEISSKYIHTKEYLDSKKIGGQHNG